MGCTNESLKVRMMESRNVNYKKVEADCSKESRQEDDCTRVMMTVLTLTATTW